MKESSREIKFLYGDDGITSLRQLLRHRRAWHTLVRSQKDLCGMRHMKTPGNHAFNLNFISNLPTYTGPNRFSGGWRDCFSGVLERCGVDRGSFFYFIFYIRGRYKVAASALGCCR